MRIRSLVGLVLLLSACAGPDANTPEPSFAPTEDVGAAAETGDDVIEEDVVVPEVLALPSPRPAGELSFEEVLAARRSVRDFTPEPLTLEEISQLLWAAQGVTAEWGGRTAPSAGALYPLELYLATQEGLYHYLPDGHRVEVLVADDLRSPLARVALGQGSVADAPAVLIVTGVYARTATKYGGRAERYVQLEAGHAAQNVLLQAVALGLGAVPIGAFEDRGVQEVLGVPQDHDPLYLIPVGHPAPGSG